MKYLKIIFGFILFPIIMALYFSDRILTSVFWWMRSDRFVDWTNDTNAVTYSVIRVCFVVIIYAIYQLISLI